MICDHVQGLLDRLAREGEFHWRQSLTSGDVAIITIQSGSEARGTYALHEVAIMIPDGNTTDIESLEMLIGIRLAQSAGAIQSNPLIGRAMAKAIDKMAVLVKQDDK